MLSTDERSLAVRNIMGLIVSLGVGKEVFSQLVTKHLSPDDVVQVLKSYGDRAEIPSRSK